MISPKEVIRALGLVPLGFEGGYFRETSRSEKTIDGRSLGTSIYYLLDRESQSLLHRLQSDEVYHFYLGDPVELLQLNRDGSSERILLGSDLALHRPQHLVPAMSWQGSRLCSGGNFALMGTTMSPGFDLRDFELGDRDVLLASHPTSSDLIRALTPECIKTERLELVAGTVDLIHAGFRGPEILAAGLRARVPDGWPPPLNDESSFRFALDKLSEGRAQRSWWLWYVIDRLERTAIGIVGFKGPPDPNGLIEIGYSILPSHQRRGFAIEAVRALLDWARARGARRFRGETLPDLLPSIRLMEKLGFVRVEQNDEILRFERDAS